MTVAPTEAHEAPSRGVGTGGSRGSMDPTFKVSLGSILPPTLFPADGQAQAGLTAALEVGGPWVNLIF
jgi:hypothetical protein